MNDIGDYISREAALAFQNEIEPLLCRNVVTHDIMSATKDYDLVKYLLSIPAADVRPNVTGRWIDHQQGRWIYAKCSECETVHDVRSNFCPNCGAKMEASDA